MLPSPYAPGGIPEYLAGRSAEIGAFDLRASRVAMLNRSGGPLLAFYGPRGLGKTSLIRAAQDRAVGEGFLTAWVTGSPDEPMTPRVAQSLSEQLQRRSWGERGKQLLHRLDKIQVELGVPGAKVSLETRPGPGSDLRTTLREAATVAREHDGRGVALFVDEFQEARLEDRKALLIALQEFDAHQDAAPVVVTAAGLPSMLAVVPESATFGERTEFRPVGLLSDLAVAEALRLPADRLGVRWTDDAILDAIGHAQGYPHLVQVLGEEVWAVARPEAGTVLTEGHVHQALDSAESRMATLFDTRLAKLTPAHQRFVQTMAELGDGPVARATLADRLDTASQSLSDSRQQLIDRGLVEPAGHGQLRFTLPGFAAHVRQRTALAGDLADSHGTGLEQALPPLQLKPTSKVDHTTPKRPQPPGPGPSQSPSEGL